VWWSGSSISAATTTRVVEFTITSTPSANEATMPNPRPRPASGSAGFQRSGVGIVVPAELFDTVTEARDEMTWMSETSNSCPAAASTALVASSLATSSARRIAEAEKPC
jgi:hypothetical protein